MTGQSAQSLPAWQTLEMQELANTYQLGAPLAEYRGGFSKGALTAINMIIALAGLVYVLLIISMVRHNPAFTLQEVGVVVGVITLVGAVLIWLIGFPARRRRRTWRVCVFSNGFVFVQGGQPDVSRWEEIQVIWHQVKVHNRGEYGREVRHFYIIERFDGRRIVLDDKIKKLEKLGNLLGEQMANAIWPRVLADYRAGNVIPFGPLSVSQQGVSNGRELLPWAAIKEVKFDGIEVKVHRKGKLFNWAKVPVGSIPNASLFLALTKYVLGK
jgi:hypothetical protein